MVKNTLAVFGILAVLVFSLGMVSAAPGSIIKNGITLTVNETELIDVTAGEIYSFEVTVENANGTAYNVSFGVSDWSWNNSGVTIANGSTEAFIGTLTVTSAQTKKVIAKFYNIANSSEMLLQIDLPISLSFLEIPGCMDDTANNYNPNATVNDTSCTYDVIPPAETSQTFCELEDLEEEGDLEISDFEITNIGEGSDDEWRYLDEIEIIVSIENTNDDEDVEDVEVKIAIFDNEIDAGGTDVTNNFDIEDEILTSIGKLRDGDEETVTFLIEELSS